MNTIEELIQDLNGEGLITFRPTHPARYSIMASHIRTDGTPGPDVHCLNEAEANFFIATLEGRAYFKTLGASVTLYSQRDPRWRNEIYAGNLTFSQAGCYVTCVAMIASLAGYSDDPPEVARKLREAKIFSGALLARPDKIPEIYPRLHYGGTLRWHKVPADMEKFKKELAEGVTIVEVDFRPPTTKLDQHFVVVERFTADSKDLVICDPWSGSRTKLLEQYAQDHWDLKRALYGMRLLRKVTP